MSRGGAEAEPGGAEPGWVEPGWVATACLREAHDRPFLLFHSQGPVSTRARHSFLALDPTEISTGPDTPPLADLRRLLGPLRPSLPGPGFRGGIAGFIGYDQAAAWHTIRPPPPDQPDPVPGHWFGRFGLVIGFDRQTRHYHIHAETPAGRAWARALLAKAGAPSFARLPPLAWHADWTADQYRARLMRLLDYIRAGDIFQANLTMRHQARRPQGLDPAALYAALAARNPAPFGAWLHTPDFDLLSASPERFLSVHAGGRVEARPIKGTAPRPANPAADPGTDQALAATLCASVKDRAENTMIVDVLRNDIGRVAALGSVQVPELCRLESFATVHHLVSSVTATLAPGRDAFDLLAAALPGGSITGAPKIRAMQILAGLEAVPRGPYCGMLGWLGTDGAMDSAILIRTVLLTPTRLVAQAGGGIVADSDPDREYAEMRLKAGPALSLGTLP